MGNCIVCRMYMENNWFMDLLKHQRKDHIFDKYTTYEFQKIGEEK